MLEWVGRTLMAFITLVKSTPLRSENWLHSSMKGQDGGPVGIFDDLAGFALDGPVEHGQGKFFDVEHVREKVYDPLPGTRH